VHKVKKKINKKIIFEYENVYLKSEESQFSCDMGLFTSGFEKVFEVEIYLLSEVYLKKKLRRKFKFNHKNVIIVLIWKTMNWQMKVTSNGAGCKRTPFSKTNIFLHCPSKLKKISGVFDGFFY
jgi:hypothetical protein